MKPEFDPAREKQTATVFKSAKSRLVLPFDYMSVNDWFKIRISSISHAKLCSRISHEHNTSMRRFRSKTSREDGYHYVIRIA